MDKNISGFFVKEMTCSSDFATGLGIERLMRVPIPFGAAALFPISLVIVPVVGSVSSPSDETKHLGRPVPVTDPLATDR